MGHRRCWCDLVVRRSQGGSAEDIGAGCLMKKVLFLFILLPVSISSCQKGNPNDEEIKRIYIDVKTSISGIKDEIRGASNFQLDLMKRIPGVNRRYSFTDDRSEADLIVAVDESYGNAAGKITYGAMIVITRRNAETIYQGKTSDSESLLEGQNKTKERIAEVINRELKQTGPE